MPLIEVLPHESLCPDGKHIDAEPGVVASIVRSWPADWPLAEAEALPSPVPLLAHA